MVTHDATTGFHDIKPLPQFVVNAPPLAPWIAAILAFALLVFVLIVLRRRFLRSMVNRADAEPVEARLERELMNLKGAKLSARDAGERLSFLLRSYIEERFAIPAEDRTNRELLDDLSPSLKKLLPVLGEEKREALKSECAIILCASERLTFADHSGDLDESEFIQLVDRSQALVRNFFDAWRREDDRVRSAIAQDPK
jgi:hypothetical protein